MVWGCFAGDTVSDLFRIQGTLNQHGYHSILQRYAISSGLRLWDYHLFFNRRMTQHTPRLFMGNLPKKESAASDDLKPVEMVWDLARRVKEKQPTRAQHMRELLQDGWKSIPGEAG